MKDNIRNIYTSFLRGITDLIDSRYMYTSCRTLTILFLLQRIGEHLTSGSKSKQDNVTIVTFGAAKSFISAMKTIHNASNSIVGGEPVQNESNMYSSYKNVLFIGR